MNFFTNFKLYTDKSVISMLPLGFAAGLPLPLLLGTLSMWLREAGIARSTITMLSWVALTYACKWLWSPLVDNLHLPLLHRLLGRRRSWMLLSQIGIICGILLMAVTDPQYGLAMLVYSALLTAFCSATYDIALDAYRIEAAPETKQAGMSANYILGYRIGMLAATAGALVLVSGFDTSGTSYSYSAWSLTYILMASFIGVGIITTLVVKEPEVTALRSSVLELPQVSEFMQSLSGSNQRVHHMFGWLYGSVVLPIIDFIQRYHRLALAMLLLIGVYRISDIVLGSIASVFYLDIGFTKLEIAQITKVYGTLFTLLGAFIGGLWVNRRGIMSVLLWGGIFTAVTNLGFAALNGIGANTTALTGLIALDNLSAGIATVAFIAYLSSLANKQYSATQYAVFSSLMSIAPKILAGFSGSLVDSFGYSYFFIGTAIIGLPVVILIVWLMRAVAKGVE
jgi:MFS transporter, PAT family, beta-lactamase induction signal transducer AmpG